MRTASFSLGLEIMLPLVRLLHRMGPRRRAAASLQSRPAPERARALAGPTGRRIPGFESEGEQPSGDNGSGGSSRGGHSPRRGDSRRLQPEFRRAYGGKGEGRRAFCLHCNPGHCRCAGRNLLAGLRLAGQPGRPGPTSPTAWHGSRAGPSIPTSYLNSCLLELMLTVCQVVTVSGPVRANQD